MLPGQSQKEFFVNEALGILDGLWQVSVEGTVATPPSEPTVGECWIVASAATGEWIGEDSKLALWSESGWSFISPVQGMFVFDKSSSQFRRYDNGWNAADPASAPQGGSVIDVEARAAIGELVAALRTFGVFPPS
nr:DUF2793 domain-containing protein [Altererythrobacter lutimaris]